MEPLPNHEAGDDASLELFSKISEGLVSKNRLDDILELIVSVTAKVMKTKVCSVMLLDDKAGELRIAATQSLSDAYVKKAPVKIGESVSGRVVKTGRAISVPDVSNHPDFAFPEVAREEGLLSMLSVPMRLKERIIGVINCYTRHPHTFTDAETRMLQAVANQAAVAIERTRLQEENLAVKKALEDRKLVDQAKAVLMEANGLSEPEAYKLLQKTSRDHRQSMGDVARSVILVHQMKKGPEKSI